MNVIKWETIPEIEGEKLNVHIGHTNFSIKREHVDILDSIEGIEAVNVPSRYRFVLSIGQCFSWKKVKEQIETQFNCSNKMIRQEVIHTMLKKQSEFNKLYKFWVAYVFPNQNVIVKHSDSLNGLLAHINNFKNLKEMSGGILMVPESVEEMLKQYE